jgi:hypothetical protein
MNQNQMNIKPLDAELEQIDERDSCWETLPQQQNKKDHRGLHIQTNSFINTVKIEGSQFSLNNRMATGIRAIEGSNLKNSDFELNNRESDAYSNVYGVKKIDNSEQTMPSANEKEPKRYDNVLKQRQDMLFDSESNTATQGQFQATLADNVTFEKKYSDSKLSNKEENLVWIAFDDKSSNYKKPPWIMNGKINKISKQNNPKKQQLKEKYKSHKHTKSITKFVPAVVHEEENINNESGWVTERNRSAAPTHTSSINDFNSRALTNQEIIAQNCNRNAVQIDLISSKDGESNIEEDSSVLHSLDNPISSISSKGNLGHFKAFGNKKQAEFKEQIIIGGKDENSSLAEAFKTKSKAAKSVK